MLHFYLFGHANELNANSPQARVFLLWKAIVTFLYHFVFLALQEAIISFIFSLHVFFLFFVFFLPLCNFQAFFFNLSLILSSLLFYLNMECKIRNNTSLYTYIVSMSCVKLLM